MGSGIVSMVAALRRRAPGRRFRRDVGSLWAAQVVVLVASVGQGILVAHWLGARDYGVAGLVMAYPGLLYAFLDARSGEVSVRYLSEFHAKRESRRALAMAKTAYLVDAGVGLTALAVVALTATWAEHHVVKGGGTASLLVLYAGALLLRSPAPSSAAILSALGHFGTYARARAGLTALRMSLVVGAVAARPSVASVVIANAAGLVVEGAVLAVIAQRAARQAWEGGVWSASLRPLRGRRREIARFMAYADLAGLMGSLIKELDVVLLGALRGPTEAGYYRLARSLGEVPGHVIGPMEQVVYPRLARAATAGDRASLRRAVTRYTWHGSVPIALVLAAVALPAAPPAIRLLAGESFAPAGAAAQVLLAGSIAWLAWFWLRPLTLALGRARFWAGLQTLTAVVSVALFVAVVPRWGFLGMAWARVATGVVVQAVAVVVVLRSRDLRGSAPAAPAAPVATIPIAAPMVEAGPR